MISGSVQQIIMWDKVFKNGSSKICGRQPLKILHGPLLNTLSHVFEFHPSILLIKNKMCNEINFKFESVSLTDIELKIRLLNPQK